MPAQNILILGASGFVGSHLVPELIAEGHLVRVASRDLPPLESFGWPGVELLPLDFDRPETLDRACGDIDTIYYLLQGRASDESIEDVEQSMARSVCEAADRAGVKRIIYLSVLQEGGGEPLRSSQYLRARYRTSKILASGAASLTELRAAIVIGPGSVAFELMRDVVMHLPVVFAPPVIENRAQPIALDNVLEYLLAVLKLPEAEGRRFDISGPAMLSYREQMEQMATVMGKSIEIKVSPRISRKIARAGLSLASSVPRDSANALLSGMGFDFRAKPEALRALVPQKLLMFDEAVQSSLLREQASAGATRWRQGSLRYRNYDPRNGYFAKTARGSATTNASPAEVWSLVERIGGERGYYFGDWLWRLRGWMDFCAGGRGNIRRRDDAVHLRPRGRVDSWRIITVQEGRMVELGLRMKAPGAGILQIEVIPEGSGSRLEIISYWHPSGFWGMLYWRALAPVLGYLLPGMARSICARAEQQRSESGVVSG